MVQTCERFEKEWDMVKSPIKVGSSNGDVVNDVKGSKRKFKAANEDNMDDSKKSKSAPFGSGKN